jgi:protein MpaA
MWKPLGRSVEGREILSYLNSEAASGGTVGGGTTLLLGGTHGDERATIPLLESFIGRFLESRIVGAPVVVIPLLNPDGYARDTRYNARGADINRNFPHNWSAESEEPPGVAPLSEPETRLIHDFILDLKPARIVSLHWALAEIDADGAQSVGLARAMWQSLPDPYRAAYRLRTGRDARGAGPPGSMGQWCGHGLARTGRAPAMITLELPHHPHPRPRPDPLPEGHLEEVRALWRSSPAGYLQGVEGPVHRMLATACAFGMDVSAPADGP